MGFGNEGNINSLILESKWEVAEKNTVSIPKK